MTISVRQRRQAIAASLSSLVLAAIAESHGSRGFAGVLLVIGVSSTAYFARRPRLSIDARGITVANLLRTFRVPWSEVNRFGFGWIGLLSCLQVHRRDGSTVNAWALSDTPSGYPRDRVQEIVAELRERLVAAGGTVDSGDVVPAPAVFAEPRSQRFASAVPHMMWVLVCGFFLVFGAATAWHAWKDLPRTYARLRASGVPATARFAGCSVVGLRQHRCRLTLTYEGTMRTWTYPQDHLQFLSLPTGSPVPVLVDPEHPATVYTAHDVESGYDAGVGGLSVFGVVLGGLGLAFFFWLRRIAAATRRADEGRSRRLYRIGIGRPLQGSSRASRKPRQRFPALRFHVRSRETRGRERGPSIRLPALE